MLLVVLVATPAAADTFGGFSGVDSPYLVNQDRVCRPLAVKDGVANGMPACEKATADVIAKLSIKEPTVQRGAKATFGAVGSGRMLTVLKKTGDVVVSWNAPDPISRVVDVYTSQYEDRIAVTYIVRRLSKDTTEVIAFELVKTTGRDPGTAPTMVTPQPPTTTTPTPTTPAPAPPEDPKLKKAVEAARKATKGKALAAWQAVLALDKDHSEATYRIAVIQLGAKKHAEAMAAIEKLAKSSRPDAIEWLVEARFDKAFASLRSDAKFRTAVGLDRKAQTPYERVMGFGGQWEQTGTSCDTPEVRLTMGRDRTFKLRVKSVCRGQSFEQPFKGTWRIEGDGVILTLPTKGKQASAKDEAPCSLEKERMEDSMHCELDRDLDFVVLPARR